MKIINKTEFMKMPIGTIFSYYTPSLFSQLMIKGENCGEDDFFLQDLIGNLEAESSEEYFENSEKTEKGESIELDFHVESREGWFDDSQLYAIYEKKDVFDFIERLREAVLTM